MGFMRRRITITAIALVTLIAASAIAEIPTKLSDAEFWKLVSDLSEPSGAFHSDVRPGRAYIGVLSEQNFTYIAALRPSIAFIVDIRRGNLDLHLLYKTLFELSVDRAEFVSRLFSRPRPSGLNGGGGFGGRSGGGLPSYAELMTANDGTGKSRSYLATEEAFRFVKDLETRNLIVPIVGNFGRPKANEDFADYLSAVALNLL
jgi:hypothetical protein